MSANVIHGHPITEAEYKKLTKVNGNILIDVGYYNSVLTIFVVCDYDWESPLIKQEYQSWENMLKDLTTICLDFSM